MCRRPAALSSLNLKCFEVSKQSSSLGSWCFQYLSSTLQIGSAVLRQTARHNCCRSVLILTHDLTLLSQAGDGLPASSCGLSATERPVALSPSVSPCHKDIIVSVLLVLKSPSVDVEDFDRVVVAGAGELDPGALLLSFTLSLSLSVLPVILSTH